MVSHGLSKQDIENQLMSGNIESIEDVQYAEIQIDGNLYIETKESKQGTSCLMYKKH